MCNANASPASPPWPGTTLKTPGGMPASTASSARRSAVYGDFSLGFKHDRVARCQCRPELPRRHDHRVVPGHDDADHAHRLARDQRQRGRGRGCDLVIDLVDRLGVPGDRARGGRHIDGQRILDRLAHVERFEQGEFFFGTEDLRGEGLQQLLAHRWRLPAPSAVGEGGAGALHCGIDIGFAATRHRPERAAVDRRRLDEGFAANGVAALAVDQRTAIEAGFSRARMPIGHC